MSRLLSGSLTLLLACSLAFALSSMGSAGGKTANAPPQSTGSPALSGGDAREAAGAQLMRSIAALNPYIVRNTDGSVAVQAPAAVLAGIPVADLASLNASVSVLNSGVRAGRLTTYTGGLVQLTGANSLVLSDGRTGTFYNWWGISDCISHADLANYRTGYATGAVVAALMFAVDEGLGAVVAVAFWFFTMFDRGNGACANQPWGGGYMWMSPQ
jgi:hypothetical protein